MKRIKYLAVIVFFAIFAACGDLSDPGGPVDAGGGMTIDDDSPAGLRIKKALEDHGVFFKYKFSETDYSYSWTSSLSGMPYTLATDQESIIKAIDYIEKEIFGLFPAGFIKKYMPPTILLVDSLKMTYKYDDYKTDPEEHWQKYYNIPGMITSSSLVIANVNNRFNDPNSPETAALKEELISLFTERLLNNPTLPYPEEFWAVSDGLFKNAVNANGVGLADFYYPYWDGNFASIKTWSSPVPEFSDWWGRAILRIGRLGDMGYSREMLLGIIEYTEYFYAKCTLGQDFGDYAAFILMKNAQQKQAFYDIIEAQPIGNPDIRIPQGGPPAVAAMKLKVQLVKNYFRENFGVTLQEPN